MTEQSRALVEELLGEVTRDFSMLWQEVELAKAELRQVASAAGMVGGDVLCRFIGLR